MSDWPDACALLEQLRSGRRDVEAVVREHLHRLESGQSRLNAATEILREEALEQARDPRPGPLSGLPISLKETFALAGREVTIGSKRMPPIVCQEDAPVVRRLKDAGAIVIARSNVPEFVMCAETDNLRFGRSRNPLDPRRTCGGSSGGEGALVASGASALGFGTDILGSIRIPAAFCGLVGFRPHSGAVDKQGVWPVSGPHFETWNGIGPLARSVRDVRLAYSVIAETPPSPPAEVAGLRLVVPEGFPLKIDAPAIGQAVVAARAGLKAAGMDEERPAFTDIPRLFDALPRLVTGEMLPLWRQWLSAAGAPFSPGREALAQVLRQPSIYPGLFLWFLLAPLYRPRTPERLAEVVALFDAARVHYQDLLGSDGILCLPTLGMLAPRHGQMNRKTLLRPGLNGRITAHTFANYINLSAITVPMPRFRDSRTGLVPGVMLAAAPGGEGPLLDCAAVLEDIGRDNKDRT